MSITNADARALRSSNAYIPLSYDKAEMSLNACYSLLRALLETQHGVVRELICSLSYYQGICQQLQMVMIRRLGPRLAPATFVYFYHVHIHGWFEDQWHVGETNFLPAPDLCTSLHTFYWGHNLAWLPNTTLVPQFDVFCLRLVPQHTPAPPGAVPHAVAPTQAPTPVPDKGGDGEPAVSARSGCT